MKNVSFRRNGVEFEPTKQELKIVLDDYAKQLGEKDKRIADLERQLAEKEKAHMEAMENALNDFLTLRQELNQAKTDFAIGQLEQVKQWCSRYAEDLIDRDDGLVTKVIGLDDTIYSAEVGLYDFIDNQIKELKGEENV